MLELMTALAIGIPSTELAMIAHANNELAIERALDPDLTLAIVRAESGFNKKAVGKAFGERGLMQLHPKYFKNVPFDIVNNMTTGFNYLQSLKKACSIYGEAWFVCYNTGPNVRLKEPRKHPYFLKVMGFYEEIQENRRRIARHRPVVSLAGILE